MTEGFLKLMRPGEAVRMLIEKLPPGGRGTEEIHTTGSMGRVAAEDVAAPENMPGFERSVMDGFAVRASDTFGAGEGQPAYLEIAGEVPMGRETSITVEPGCALSISTGAMLPQGADAVVMVENTEVHGDSLEIFKGVAPGENVLARDEDVPRGEIILRRGSVIRTQQIGALVGLGITRLEVFGTPVVGIISTGDELVEPGAEPGPGQVRDVNSAALAAAVAADGCAAKTYGIVTDDFERLLGVSKKALDECDALLVSGGSSAGTRDATSEVLDALGPPGVLAHGLYIKPGKPTLVALCNGRPAIGLPGNPASALAVFREVVVPVLERLRGIEPHLYPEAPAVVVAVLDRSISSATGRMELVPVSLRTSGERLVATPIAGKSSLIGTLARSHGQIRIPEGSEGLERGEIVTVELLG